MGRAPAVLLVPVIVIPLVWHEKLDDFISSLQPDVLSDLFRTGAQIFGALLGFVIAALAILLAVGETDSIRALYRSGRSRDIFSIYTSASTWLGSSTVLCVLGLVANREQDLGWPVPWIVLYSVVVAMVRLGWSIWILQNVISLVIGDKQSPSSPPPVGGRDPERGID